MGSEGKFSRRRAIVDPTFEKKLKEVTEMGSATSTNKPLKAKNNSWEFT